MKGVPIITLLLFCCFSAASADRVGKLRGMKDAAVERAVDPVNTRHVAELEKLLETMSAAGELEGALKVKEELSHVKQSPAELSESEGTEYRRLNDLRERRNGALEKAVGPINETYVSELRKLQKELTNTGDLEQAKLAKETLEVFQLNGEIGAGSVTIDELAVHHLVGTSWTHKNAAGTEVFKFEEGRFQVFKPDGSGGLKAGDFRSWQIENPERRQIRIFYHYGEEVATIDSKFTEMKDTKHVLERIVN